MKLLNRNLMNIDCNCYFYSPNVWQPEGGPFGRTGIWNFVRQVAESGVDTLVVNPSAQLLWMPSQRVEYVHEGYTKGDWTRFRANALCEEIREEELDAYYQRLINLHDRYIDLLEQGINWFEETATACRACGVAPWISIRMNDTHGGANPEAGFFGNCRMFNEDPTCRIQKPCMYPGERIQRFAMDYSQQRVRDHMMFLIEECIENYDYEGIELDFLRDPIFLNPVAGKEDTERMTDWIWEIQRMARKKSLKTGRPFPLGVRSPGHLNLMRDMGLDIRALVQRGIIDFVGFSNYWQTAWDMPHDELRKELGSEVTIYGVVEGGPHWVKAKARDASTLQGFADFYQNSGDRPMQYCTELVRGNAVTKLVLGADGIEQFNNFYSWDTKRMPMKPAYEALENLPDLEFLRGKEKLYTFSTQGRNPSTNVPYETVELLPELLEPETRRGFRIPMCREPLQENLELVVQVICDQQDDRRVVGASFNGCWPCFTGEPATKLLFPCGIYTDIRDDQQAYNFIFDLELIREGWNQICVFNGAHNGDTAEENRKRTIRVLSVEIGIRKKKLPVDRVV